MRRLAGLLVLTIAACDAGPRPSASSPSSPPPSTPAPKLAAPAPSNPPEAAPRRGSGTAAGLFYLERVTGGATATDRLPMIVALHGLGDRPRSFLQLFNEFPARARVIALRAPDAYARGFSWFPFRMRDQSPEKRAEGIGRAAERVAAALDELPQTLPTVGKPIVTGFSQGGMLSFALGTQYADKISLSVPVGGMLPGPLRPTSKPKHTVRIVALHGKADRVVLPEPTREAVSQLSSLGLDATLREYDQVGHNIPEPMRGDLHRILADACEALAKP